MPPIPAQPSVTELIPTLEPDAPAETFIESSLLLPLCLAAAVTLLAVGGLLLWWRLRTKRPAAHTQTPLETALAALDGIAAEVTTLRECSLRVSMLLRSYLAGQVQDTALYETHEEFSHRMDSLANVPAACRDATSLLLDELAALKYAPSQQSDPLRVQAITESARALVQDIAAAQAAEAEAKRKEEAA